MSMYDLTPLQLEALALIHAMPVPDPIEDDEEDDEE